MYILVRIETNDVDPDSMHFLILESGSEIQILIEYKTNSVLFIRYSVRVYTSLPLQRERECSLRRRGRLRCKG